MSLSVIKGYFCAKVDMWKVPLFDLNYDEREVKAVEAVLKSKWLSMGLKVQEFEKDFSLYLGGGVFSVAVSNCTVALHLSLLANDIGEGDEVIMSGLTFIACLNVIKMSGATPVLADSKSFSDWNVSPLDIAAKITQRTKAVIIVHYGGYPVDLDEIIKICRNNKLILIEDTAHAVGAEYKGKKCGTFGEVGCFSFFSNKNLSTGEGGMLVTKNKALNEKFKLLRSHGMTSMSIDRYNDNIISYDVVVPGTNYRLNEIMAALGIEQLKKLDQANLKRKKITAYYQQELSGIKGIIIPWLELPAGVSPSYHIFPVMLPEDADRKKIMGQLREAGIQSSIHYPAFREFSYYRRRVKEKLKVAEEVSRRVLTLPLYSTMMVKDVDLVSKTLADCI